MEKHLSKREDTWVVIPAFNEASVIYGVVEETRRSFQRVLVIDDCSQDATAELACRAGATVIRHPINLGQGAALETGLEYLRRNEAKIAILFDADGQHRIEDAIKMVGQLEATGIDVVLGSRFLGEAINMPRHRRVLLKAATVFTKLTSGLEITDAHNGLRVFGRNAIHRIRLRQNRMAHASEILTLIGREKLSYQEAPVQIRYTAYSLAKGQSMWNSINILLDLLIARVMT